MSFDPAAALARYHAVLDRRDLAGVAGMLAQDARYVSVGLGDVSGRDAIMAALEQYFATSPDHQAFDDEIRTLGPRTAQSLWRLTATNRQTGTVVERRGREVVTFDDDGLITVIAVEDA